MPAEPYLFRTLAKQPLLCKMAAKVTGLKSVIYHNAENVLLCYLLLRSFNNNTEKR